MASGWRYRVLSVTGVVGISVLTILAVNSVWAQSLAATLPVLSGLPVDPAISNTEVVFEVATGTVVVATVFVPLYKPRSRRILDTIALSVRRVTIVVTVLATIGYFDYTFRLPRLSLLLATPILFVTLPAWFVTIRRRPTDDESRAVIVGNDPAQIEAISESTDDPIVGYVSPPNVTRALEEDTGDPVGKVATDGGVQIGAYGCLAGLSKLDEVFVDHDIDTAILAFTESDRREFFGALDECYDHGVAVKVHRKHAAAVLTSSVGGEVVDVELEPWDWQDRVLKRAFDLAFAGTGLLVLAPVICVIALAIKFDDGGSILYTQERTASLGETFPVHKFRSMVEDAEASTGVKLSDEDAGGVDPRVTRVGRVLRQTHLDEIPQLWAILTGHMSVVGPRPERPELDTDIQSNVGDWQKRWFVKPGLTGLAQINGATGHEPDEKLAYDLRYVQIQSFWTDVKIVLRQIFDVLRDAWVLLR